jgi:hypothetical protein
VIALRPDLKVVMAAQPVDFRKSVHTLSALVSDTPSGVVRNVDRDLHAVTPVRSKPASFRKPRRSLPALPLCGFRTS